MLLPILIYTLAITALPFQFLHPPPWPPARRQAFAGLIATSVPRTHSAAPRPALPPPAPAALAAAPAARQLPARSPQHSPGHRPHRHWPPGDGCPMPRSEEHTSELQS